MKKIFLLLLLPAGAYSGAYAQDSFEEFKKQTQQEFNTFKSQTDKELKEFRDRANAEFAEFMRKRWEEFNLLRAIPIPPSPDPVVPPVVDPKKKPTSDPIPFEEVVPVPQPVIPPQPIAPMPPSPQPAKEKFSFLFYNTECKVDLKPDQRIRLSDLSEQTVADAWEKLSDSRYNNMVGDCLDLRRKLKLCDWAYIQLVKQMSEKYYASATSSEATLLQMYILSQSGYKVRLARAGERLALLVPSRQTIYTYSYVNIDNLKYYLLDKSLSGKALYVFNHEFSKEQLISLQLEQPNLSVDNTTYRTFTSQRYPDVSVTVKTNRNLVDFLGSYPVSSDWNLYSKASLSPTLKTSLYPALRKAIAGQGEVEAANRLINFVQTAFKYQTDDAQFGYERPLFADETFYYPASDCEDRSILYSILVRELLGLEVVLLHYPGHLATAVCFSEKVEGDYLMVGGKKFVVCDPTYIGANVGRAMEQFKTVKASVVKI
ncbi:MAG: hypothetical protein LBH84_07940 [Prevotellaceae bacterium]|jgi:hypothetical protein|nr:hypothetical protein [Prevotellaceae bacterium]